MISVYRCQCSFINADSLHEPFLLALSPQCEGMPDSSTKHVKTLSLTNSLSLQRQVSWKTKPKPDLYFILLFFLTSYSFLLHCNLFYTTLLKMLLQRLPMNSWASCCSIEQCGDCGGGKRRGTAAKGAVVVEEGLWGMCGGKINSTDILHLLSSRSIVEPGISLSLNLSPFLASMIPLLPCFPHYLPGSSSSVSVVLSFSLFLKSWCSRGLHSIPVNLYSLYSPGFTLSTFKASATIHTLMIFKPTSLA